MCTTARILQYDQIAAFKCLNPNPNPARKLQSDQIAAFKSLITLDT